MENSAQQSEMDSLRGTGLLSSGSFVAVAVVVAVGAVCLLPGTGIPQMVLPGAVRVALVVVMVLGFLGVLVSSLLNLPDTTRRTLVVLFATALLCAGFVALVGWFAVSGASSCWL